MANTENKHNLCTVTKEEYEKKLEGMRGCLKIVTITALTTLIIAVSAAVMIKKHYDEKKKLNNTSWVDKKTIAEIKGNQR